MWELIEFSPNHILRETPIPPSKVAGEAFTSPTSARHISTSTPYSLFAGRGEKVYHRAIPASVQKPTWPSPSPSGKASCMSPHGRTWPECATSPWRILVLTKRQYMNRDLLDHRFGRFWEIPLALAGRGHRTEGLCLSYRSRKYNTLGLPNLNWSSVNTGPLLWPGIAQFLLQADRLARRSDVIWACSDSIYGILGVFLARRHHIPCVFDLYDNFEYYLLARQPLIKQLYRRAVRQATAVTCVSRPLARYLIATCGRTQSIHILENAVRGDLFKPMDKRACRNLFGFPQDALIVGTAGALEKSRGTEVLFSAFEQLKERKPRAHLALAGPRSRLLDMPQGPSIHDAGFLALHDVPAFLNTLDVAVICNKENEFGSYCFPQKAREIMACQIPWVAAGVGSMKELLADYPEWLYVPSDSSDLAQVLENRLQDDRVLNHQPYTWEDAAASLEGVLASVLQDRTGQPQYREP